MGKISLYGSFLLIIVSIGIMIFMGVGIKGILIGMVFLAGIISVLYILSFLPEIWVIMIVFCSIIVFTQYVIQSWLFSMGLLVLMLVYVLFHVMKMTGRWKGTVVVIFFIMINIGLVVHLNYKPTIEGQILQEVSEKMSEDPRVHNASLETDENEVHCFLVVADDVLLTERTEIGETCAKTLSDQVDIKDKRFQQTNTDVGALYDYYGLKVDVFKVEKGKPLEARKFPTEEAVDWYVNRNLSDGESKLKTDLQYGDLSGTELTMTAAYDAYHLDFHVKNIHIRFNQAEAIVEANGGTTKYNYHIADNTKIVFEDGSDYRLDVITQDELLFLDQDREGKGYIFKVD